MEIKLNGRRICESCMGWWIGGVVVGAYGGGVTWEEGEEASDILPLTHNSVLKTEAPPQRGVESDARG